MSNGAEREEGGNGEEGLHFARLLGRVLQVMRLNLGIGETWGFREYGTGARSSSEWTCLIKKHWVKGADVRMRKGCVRRAEKKEETTAATIAG